MSPLEETINAREVLRETLAAYTPEAVTVWSGAGVSIDPPTCGPTGYDLTERAIEAAYPENTLSTIRKYYEHMHMDRSHPRLETVLDAVQQVCGQEAIGELLGDLRAATPNYNHRVFARHLHSGGTHITTNFDTCIERAEDSVPKGKLIHVHGALGGENQASLGATLSAIQHGLPAVMREQLTKLFTSDDRRLLVFVGYSGSDYFDVDPFLRELAASNNLSKLSAVWISHKASLNATRRTGETASASTRILQYLYTAGADVSEYRCHTRSAIQAFAEWIGMASAESARPADPGVSYGAFGAQTKSKRHAVAIALYAKMGLHKEVLRLHKISPVTGHDYGYLASAYWAAGEYRAAATAWANAVDGTALNDHLRVVERLAACSWLRGQNRKAEGILRRALEIADHEGSVPGSIRVALGETYGRVITHMARMPDTIIFATKSKKLYALSHLPDPILSTSIQQFDTLMLAKLASVRENLGAGRASLSLQRSADALAETEELNAHLNYRHGLLRERYQNGDASKRTEYLELHDNFMTIGAAGDAFRVMLLPGAQLAFSLPEFLSALRRIDFTRWHMLRLLVGYLYLRGVVRTRVMLGRE